MCRLFARVVMLAAAVAAAGAAWARPWTAEDPAALTRSTTTGAERYFDIEWEPAERNGQPLVTGRVRSNWGFLARNMVLRVDSVGPAGDVIATALGYVPGPLGTGAVRSFEIPVAQRAPSYRVSIHTFDWSSGGDGQERLPLR